MNTNTVTRRYLVAPLLLILCGVMGSCSSTDKKQAEQTQTTDTLRPTTNDRIVGVACIEPEEGILNITAGTTGKIVAVLIDDNQLVGKGQALLDIEVSVEKAQLMQAQSKVATQQATVEASKASLEAQKVNLTNTQATYERNLQLYQGKALTKQALDDSKATLDRQKRDVEAAEANLRQANERIQELQADIRYYQSILTRKKVNAPLNGQVLNVLVNTGDYVNNDTKIAEFAPEGPFIARTEVDELYAEKVSIGQQAYIFSQTTGDTLGLGKVSFLGDYLKQKSLFKDQSTEQEDRRVREVHIRLDPGKKPLIGSRVDCLILLK
ncbi:MAG: efflux RND transporter periplasmic adaptor subunit [Spirosomataceae bacterium]